ncbi:MAG: molybdate ABC transporter substrate-binding protein [Parvibaculaceae bacterium]|nr:molybdate ABC transporter substrate-binding protein [Parvibaculaceae bacterium]
MLRSYIRFAFALLLLGTLAHPALAGESVTIFAAASLKNAVDEAGVAFTKETGIEIRATYAASSVLAKQIESGAPADVFASADTKWMDYLAKKDLIQPATRIDLLGNTLVVVARKDAPFQTLPLTAEALLGAIGDSRWATGDVASVPVGIYARAAFTKLGLWPQMEPKLASAENVRSALAFVSRGEAPIGVVYGSDVSADPDVRIVATFPEDSHPPIIYPFALTREAKGDASSKFLAFLASKEGEACFKKQGFTILK